MVCLLKIRGMLEQMSVIERKLADFILDNAHLLRDYSSQQLADAVGTSQSACTWRSRISNSLAHSVW